MSDAAQTSPSRPRLAVRLFGLLLGVGLLYLTLVLANLGLVEATKAFGKSAGDPVVRGAAELRKDEEDPPLIAAAIADGLKPTILPQLFDKPWRYPGFVQTARETGLPLIGGRPNTETYFCNEGYGLVDYRSDRFGLRNQDGLWDRLDAIDAIAIGDSFVHGACVEDSETITGRLAAGGLQTLNLGVAANHSLIYAYLVRTFTPAIKPKRLIVFFYANDNLAGDDLARAEESLFAERLAAGLPLDGYFDERVGPALQPSPAYKAAMGHYAKLADATRSKDKRSPFAEIFKREYWTLRHTRTMVAGLLGLGGGLNDIDKLALDEMARQCAANDCAPLAVYIPHSEAAAPDPRAAGYRDGLAAYAAEAGVPFLDTTVDVAPLGAAGFAPKGAHLSPAGYGAVADAVLRQVAKGG